MGERNQQFDSHAQWVNKASSWLTRYRPEETAICYDAKSRLCNIGRHFARARDEDAFPVRWIWPEQVVELVALNKELDELAHIYDPAYMKSTPMSDIRVGVTIREAAEEFDRLTAKITRLEEQVRELKEAVVHVRGLISEGAIEGFNLEKLPGWGERLYASQGLTHEALAKLGGEDADT